jgi:hypothetical protein
MVPGVACELIVQRYTFMVAEVVLQVGSFTGYSCPKFVNIFYG